MSRAAVTRYRVNAARTIAAPTTVAIGCAASAPRIAPSVAIEVRVAALQLGKHGLHLAAAEIGRRVRDEEQSIDPSRIVVRARVGRAPRHEVALVVAREARRLDPELAEREVSERRRGDAA